MDILAALLTLSNYPSHHPLHEASDLVWYGKTTLQDPLLDSPSNERRGSSLEPSDPQYEVRVLRNTPQSQIIQSFDRSEGQVVALVPGQALNCGIGPCTWGSSEQQITYLSAKDVLRWSKLAEWLDKYGHRNPRHEVALSQSEDIDYRNTLGQKIFVGPARDRVSSNTLLDHVSDLPGRLTFFSSRYFWFDILHSVANTPMLLTLLIALPLIYGGIHLTTWHFHFASQTEHLLWKIACIDIMGTIPFSATLSFVYIVLRTSKLNVWFEYASWILFTPLFLFYALSRIYIVVESFISLRHVPIGVYAAIPWVQDIPHI